MTPTVEQDRRHYQWVRTGPDGPVLYSDRVGRDRSTPLDRDHGPHPSAPATTRVRQTSDTDISPRSAGSLPPSSFGYRSDQPGTRPKCRDDRGRTIGGTRFGIDDREQRSPFNERGASGNIKPR